MPLDERVGFGWAHVGDLAGVVAAAHDTEVDELLSGDG